MAIRVIADIPVLDDSGDILHITEMAGPSTDQKPTSGIANGSLFLESDTGKIAVYDETAGWGVAQ